MPDPSKPSLFRSLGQFVGHIAKGVKTDPASEPKTVEKRVEVEERIEQAPEQLGGGKMTVRRTIIEEIEVDAPETDPPKADG